MLRFADFTLDCDNRVLCQGGRPVALEPKVFDCLALLAHRPGELTSLAQLRRVLWPQVRVGPDALRRVIACARRALGDSGKRQRWIQTRNGVGYAFIGEVRRVATTPDAAARADASTGTSTWPFVGREPELQCLGAALEQAQRGGQGGVCFIAGPAGSGKTQLLTELRRRTSACCWVVGHCQPGTAAAPLLPWCDLAAQLLEDPSLQQRLSRPGAEAALDALGGLAAAGESPAQDAAERLWRCHRFVDEVRKLADAAPLCIVLEDLHWADEASLLLFELLGRRWADHRLCITGTYRAEVAPLALRELVGRLAGRARVTCLELPPLTLSDLDRLLDPCPAPERRPRTPEVLLRLTGGHALFVRQLMTHLAAGGTAAARGGSSGQLPDALRLTVGEQLSTLPARSHRLLQDASALGETFALEHLARIVRRTAAELRREFEPALSAGLLARHAGDPEALCFRHGLVRACLLRSLPGRRRRQLQRATAAACRSDRAARTRLSRQRLAL